VRCGSTALDGDRNPSSFFSFSFFFLAEAGGAPCVTLRRRSEGCSFCLAETEDTHEQREGDVDHGLEAHHKGVEGPREGSAGTGVVLLVLLVVAGVGAS
jgi:hypothetical protein